MIRILICREDQFTTRQGIHLNQPDTWYLEHAIDVLSKRYFFSPIRLVDRQDGTWDVFNRNGQIVGMSVCHKGRWRAEIKL